MPEWLTNLGGIADVVGKLFGTGYNMYTNQRDFDYQKDLQNQIFQREDNAVQRRVADLQAAGLNPNLAAGSAASAGQTVSRSSTNDLNIGSIMDTLAAKAQIKKAEADTQAKDTENKILDAQLDKINFDNNLDIYSKLSYLGADVNPVVTFNNRKNKWEFDVGVNNIQDMVTLLDDNGQKTLYPNLFKFRNMLIGEQNNSYDILRLQQELLQKDYDWYTADKISGMALGLLGAGTGMSGWKKLFSK